MAERVQRNRARHRSIHTKASALSLVMAQICGNMGRCSAWADNHITAFLFCALTALTNAAAEFPACTGVGMVAPCVRTQAQVFTCKVLIGLKPLLLAHRLGRVVGVSAPGRQPRVIAGLPALGAYRNSGGDHFTMQNHIHRVHQRDDWLRVQKSGGINAM